MAAYNFLTLDVFAEHRFGGNPLAVFPDARGLDAALMQALAREFNLSETTFVLPPSDPANAARVRIFTPGRELPFAGHPTVGTGFALAAAAEGGGRDPLVLEVTAGLVPVEIRRGPDGVPTGAFVEAPQPLATGAVVPVGPVAACAGLDAADLRVEVHPPTVAGVGTDFVIAELRDGAALARAAPDPGAFRRMAERAGLAFGPGLHLYVRDPQNPARLHARMFAPLEGIAEDPATGSANAALAALLVSLDPGKGVSSTFEITQGVEMGRPSRLTAAARKTAVGTVVARIGGGCIPVSRGVLEL